MAILDQTTESCPVILLGMTLQVVEVRPLQGSTGLAICFAEVQGREREPQDAEHFRPGGVGESD